MRPAGEVRQALLQAASELVAPGRGATLKELAARACVGTLAARRTVDNLRRGGALCIVGTRQVHYRNRPVAEYAPAGLAPGASAPPAGADRAPAGRVLHQVWAA